ncbi:MAG: hypothetical protein DME26_02045 [Verrucomicrobia bacterium]|nr:MAG: hypothetical protein DME26_02045 [Verrucomicrobiota bacterium]
MMNKNELKRIARTRLAETLGNFYAHSSDATQLVEAFAWSLDRGSLVVLDSRSRTIFFRNKYANKSA